MAQLKDTKITGILDVSSDAVIGGNIGTGTLGVSGDSNLANTTVANLGVGGTCSISGTTELQGLMVNGDSTFVSAPIFNSLAGSTTSNPYILKTSSAGQVAKATANTDYLGPVTTGTWSPTLKGSSTAGTWTYTTRSGKYLKAGRLVFFAMNIAAYQSSAGSGELYCTLPFTPDSSVTSGSFSGSIGYTSGGASNYMRSAVYLQIQSSGMTFRMLLSSSVNVWSSNVASIGTGSSNAINVQCSGWYWTAS